MWANSSGDKVSHWPRAYQIGWAGCQQASAHLCLPSTEITSVHLAILTQVLGILLVFGIFDSCFLLSLKKTAESARVDSKRGSDGSLKDCGVQWFQVAQKPAWIPPTSLSPFLAGHINLPTPCSSCVLISILRSGLFHPLFLYLKRIY